MNITSFILLNGLLCLTGIAQTALPVLALSPSPYLNGMGGSGVALPTPDPFVIFANPAQIAANVHSNGVSAHFYPVKASLSDRTTADLRASAASVGYRIQVRPNQMGFRIAIGYLNTDLDLGIRTLRDQDGNEIIRTISSEYYYGITLSFAFEYRILFGFGVTYKWTTSERGYLQRPDGSLARLRTDMGIFDYGLIAALPVYDLIFTSGSNFKPFFDISAGFSKINLGEDVSYNGEIDPLPLPKISRVGFAFSAGLNTKFRGTDLNLIKTDWTREQLDHVGTGTGFENNSSHIFLSNVSGEETYFPASRIAAFDVRIFETLSYQQGMYRSDNDEDKTSRGFGITTSGLFKLLRPKYTRSIISFIFEQMEISYYQSWYCASSGIESVFYGVNVRVGGF